MGGRRHHARGAARLKSPPEPVVAMIVSSGRSGRLFRLIQAIVPLDPDTVGAKGRALSGDGAERGVEAQAEGLRRRLDLESFLFRTSSAPLAGPHHAQWRCRARGLVRPRRRRETRR